MNTSETAQPFVSSKLLPIMQEAVSCLQMVLFKELKVALRTRYAQKTEEFHRHLAAAVMNNLYSAVSEDAELIAFCAAHRELIEAELRSLKESLPHSIPIVTDSLRMKAICDNQMGVHSLGSLLMARSLGLLDEERELPMPSTFMLQVRGLATEHGLVEAPVLPATAPK